MNLLLHAIMHHPMKLQIVYLSLATPWSYWAYEAISSDHLVREILLPSCPRYPQEAALFAEVQFCRRHIVSRFRSRFFNRRSCILVDTSSVRFGSVQCRAIANQHGSTNRATTTGCHQSSIKRVLIHFDTKPCGCALAPLWSAPLKGERRQLRRAVVYTPSVIKY